MAGGRVDVSDDDGAWRPRRGKGIGYRKNHRLFPQVEKTGGGNQPAKTQVGSAIGREIASEDSFQLMPADGIVPMSLLQRLRLRQP